MDVTTLQDKLATSGGSAQNYRGAESAATYGDPSAEFRALAQGCGLVDLVWQAKLVLTGEDRVRWLNGMVTNNIRDLALNHGVYSFLLNAQGHNQGDLIAYHRGDYLLVTTDRAQVAKIKEIFDRYIIMDDVEVADVSDELRSIALVGPKSAEALAAAGITIGELAPGQVVDLVWHEMGVSIARDVLPQMEGYEVWFAAANKRAVWEALVNAGIPPAGSQALEMFRIARGLPLYGVDLRERDLVQETGQQHALNFAKGCYIGQEIVERVHSRGNVHRVFVGLEIDEANSAEAPRPGLKIRKDDKDVGEITSVTRAPLASGKRTFALGYMRQQAAEPGTQVQVEGRAATVRALPFNF